MCSRSTIVIPGLLRRINQLEAEIRRAEQKSEILEELVLSLKSENAKLHNEVGIQKRRAKIVVGIFMFLIIWVIVSCMDSPKSGKNMAKTTSY